MKRWICVFLLCLLGHQSKVKAVCELTTLGVKDSVLTLSNDQVDADTAEGECVKLGGHLASTKDTQIKNSLTTALDSKYRAGIQRVYVFYQPTNTKVYKFSKSPAETGTWKSTKGVTVESVWYIDLYTTWETGRTLLYFCRHYKLRWQIRNKRCDTYDKEWVYDFYLYGSSSATGHQTIYKYRRQQVGAHGSRLTTIQGDYHNSFSGEEYKIYAVIDTSRVFIGARYNPTTRTWLWSDGSVASFNPGGTNCKQKAYKYSKGWTTDNVDCTGTNIYYACQIKLTSSTHSKCDASVVDVLWSQNLQKLATIQGSSLTTQVLQGTTAISRTLAYGDGSYRVTALAANTDYNFAVRANFSGCSSTFVTSSQVAAKTGLKTPTPNARVENSAKCIVAVYPDASYLSNQKILRFKVDSISNSNSSTHYFDVKSEPASKTLTLQIPISHHGYNEQISLKIQALTSTCTSRTEIVTGYCQIQGCSISTAVSGSNVLTLSDDLLDANAAESKCKSLGGKLVTAGDARTNDSLLNAVQAKYANETTRVWIFYNSDYYKYSKQQGEVGSWKSTRRLGHLQHIDLFTTLAPNRIAIHFCRYYSTALYVEIQRPCTTAGWVEDFKLYAAKDATPGYKPVYAYENSGGTSVRLTDANATYGQYTKYHGVFFVPDVKVSIGARWHPSSQQWLWGDGTNADFNPINSSTCQQKVLHYGNGWIATNANCTGEKAYYVCQNKLETTATVDTCNSSFAQLQWQDNFSNLLSLTGHKIDMQVEVQSMQDNKTKLQAASYAMLKANIPGLTPRSEYIIKVKASFLGCSNFTVESSSNVTTGYGLPEGVIGAFVNSTTPCVIITPTQRNNESYLVTATSRHASTQVSFAASNQTLNLQLSSAKHGKGENVNFTIQAENCEGASAPTPVKGHCITPRSTTTTTELPGAGGVSSALIGGGVGGLLFLLLIILIVVAVVFKRRKTPTKHPATVAYTSQMGNGTANVAVNPSNGHTHGEDLENPYEIAVNDGFMPGADTYENVNVIKHKMKAIYEHKLLNNRKLFKQEYEEMLKKCQNIKHTNSRSQLAVNKERNRYKNIFPYDHARVVLNGCENDYINASVIDGYKMQRKFIASQGPKPNTMGDFWLMVWQQNASIIVMLTGLKEKEKQKCAMYWPDHGTSAQHGSVTIHTIEENTFYGIIVRKFRVQHEKETRDVTQFQFTTWPDHGIPATTSNMIYLRRMVEGAHDKRTPLVVHCSAGVGRTGTYIAMDVLCDQLDDQGVVDVPKAVLEMRNCRTDMVQTLNQYVFIYKLIMEHEMIPDCTKTASELQTMPESELSKIASEQYRLLAEVLGNQPMVYAKLQVSTWNQKDQAIHKIDAHFIEDLSCSINFIASRCPDNDSQDEFWKSAVEQQVNIVVCLEESQEDAVANCKGGSKVEFSGISIETQPTIAQNNNVTMTDLKVNISGPLQMTSDMKLVKLHQWSTAQALVSCIETVEELHRSFPEGRVLVYCRNGCTRTGTFIALVNVLGHLKAHNEVDVVRTVKDLRDLRPNMVDNKDVFMYIYIVVMEYLSAFNTYSNYR